MQQFDIRFEDMGFTNSSRGDGHEMTPNDIEAFHRRAISNGLYPIGVERLVAAYLTEDDNQGHRDRKVFACITLRVNADSNQAAERFESPRELLNTIANVLLSSGVRTPIPVHLEDSWENCDFEPVIKAVIARRPRL